MRHPGFLRLLLLTALASGCTMLDEPMFDGVRIVSGIGPYRDVGGVEVCVADHRLGTPDTELAGFCVPRTAPLRAVCTQDADCRSRESCVCGYCTVKYCTRNDECGEGRACDFTLSRCVTKCDDECDCAGPNGRCDIGMCQQLCIVNAECQSGEICSLSRARCISVPCSHDDDCFEDEACIIQREPRRFTEPSVLDDPVTGGVVVYFDMVHAGQFERMRHMIFRAITQDGREWRVDPAAPILVPEIPDDYRAPTVIRGPAGYVMYFERGAGDGILRAVSPDGRAWTIDPPTPVILPDGPFDAGRVAAPAAVVGTDGLPRIYYETGDAKRIGLVVAQDPEGRLFPSGSARQQVLTLEQVGSEVLWRGLTRIRSPYVTLDQDFEGNPLYRLWFSARGFESSEGSSFGSVEQIPANYSIGYAASRDGATFEVFPFNPVFDRIYPNTFVNHASELTPAVLDRGDHYLLFYSSADRSGGSWENIRVAVNPPPFGNE
jgi:hypothetical protein